MKRFAVLSAAALIGAGTLASTAAEARGGGAVAAGIIGGLAAGALIDAAAQAATAYGYSYDGYAPTPVVVRPRPVYRAYEDVEPVYATRRVVTYERVPVGYGHRRWRDDADCDDDDGYGRGYARRYRGW